MAATTGSGWTVEAGLCHAYHLNGTGVPWTWIAGITGSSSATLYIETGSGTPGASSSASAGGGSGGAVTIADGADATLGAKADATCTDPTATQSAMSLFKCMASYLNTLRSATQTTIVPKSAGTGTESNVASSASAVTLLAANSARLGAVVFNDSSAVCYVILSATTPTVSVYTVQVQPGGYYELPFAYSGIIQGIWASASGNARVTEFTP